jgi:small subunit ribosomal protein S1
VAPNDNSDTPEVGLRQRRSIRRPKGQQVGRPAAPAPSPAPAPAPRRAERSPRSWRAEEQAPAPAPEPPAASDRGGLQVNAQALAAELNALSGDELARLLGGGSPRSLEPGERIEGTVVRVGREGVFVDIGSKSEGRLDITEFDLDEEPQPGDTIAAFVLRADERGVKLARRVASGANIEVIENAMESGIPVEGKVASRNKGGFVVKIGSVRAFCPVSQIARIPAADLDSYIGQRLTFRVVEAGDRDVVVSARDVEEAAAEEEAAATWDRLSVDMEVQGTVVASRDFGVFVDVGGVRGLVPRSELGWDREAAAPQTGTRITARVIKVDRDAGRLTLSTKDPGASPWARVGVDFLEGGDYAGKVVRVKDFGALVQIAPGLTGLVPVRMLSKQRVESVEDAVSVGQAVTVRLMEIDGARERLTLSIKDAGQAEAAGAAGRPAPRSHRSKGSFGTLGDLLGGLNLPKG